MKKRNSRHFLKNDRCKLGNFVKSFHITHFFKSVKTNYDVTYYFTWHTEFRPKKKISTSHYCFFK